MGDYSLCDVLQMNMDFIKIVSKRILLHLCTLYCDDKLYL